MAGRTGGISWLAVVVLAAPLVIGIGGLVGLWLVLDGWSHHSDGREKRTGTDCAQALQFARGSLPEGARGGRCERTDWPDTTVTGSFRMDRSGLETWLAAAFPQAQEHGRRGRPAVCPKPGPGYDPEAGSRCITVDHPDSVPGLAKRVEISAEQQVGYDVLVRFVAYDG
ncbi:hypothetical protein [Streptomyces sp. WM6372]|uniref:hypothetical protein n=1 Tax=Streptomyces sp. WM6372 TaxID=1415555 RepID=UPI0006ADEBE0|nr:hypothetical protein [Streptomyces sp. WM6372]